MEENFQIIKNIYNNLMDEESKLIFINRLMYSLTDNIDYINDMIKKILSNRRENGDEILLKRKCLSDFIIETNKNKKIILFGTGAYGVDLYHFLTKQGFEIEAFCDNSLEKQRKIYFDKKIISPNKLKEEYKDAIIVIASQDYEEEIYNQFLTENDNVYIATYLGGKQYFDTFIKADDNEVFLDVGCCNGNTILDFIKWAGKYKKVYAFEPDKINIQKCQKNMAKNNIDNVIFVNKGAWSKKNIIKFNISGNGNSRICDEGENQIEVIDIDSVVNDDRVTFIKMDIEGAELEALKGARQTIIKNKPKLAISVYHKNEDIIEILNYIDKLDVGYKFYLRHYTHSGAETVLYAL